MSACPRSRGRAGEVDTMIPPKLPVDPLNVGRPASRLSCNTRWNMGGHHVLEHATSYRHETLSLDVSVRTLAGLHGQHNEAVFSAIWFKRHALSNNTLLSVLTRVNAETRKGCQSVIASASVTNTLLSLRWFRCGSNRRRM